MESGTRIRRKDGYTGKEAGITSSPLQKSCSPNFFIEHAISELGLKAFDQVFPGQQYNNGSKSHSLKRNLLTSKL